MAKCRNCGMELGSGATCVFATYKLEKDGKELMTCCERCAGGLDSAQKPEVTAAPAVPMLKPKATPAQHRKPARKPARAMKLPKKKTSPKAPKKRPLRRKAKSKAAPKKRRK
jgi:hypothetical protein